MKSEKAMIEKCKLEAANQSIKLKEQKIRALQQLKNLSIVDKSDKLKAKKLAERIAGDVDLTDVFKEAEKEKKDIDL
jgi:hypothetical protein